MDTFVSTKREKPKILRHVESNSGTEMMTSRPDREMRGLAMLDAYETQRTKDLGYEYTETEKEPLWSQYLFKGMFLIQIAIIIGAAIMFGGSFTAEKNGFDYAQKLRFGEIDPEVLYVPYACAAMSGVTAFVGCLGYRTRHRCNLIAYVICLGITLSLGIGACTQVKADDYNVHLYAKRQWWEMTYEQEQIYQHDHLCCNFDNIDPCCRWAVGEGECENEYMCFERIKPHLQTQFRLIGNCAILHTAILACVMVLATGLLCTLQFKSFIQESDGDFPKSIGLKTLKSFSSKSKGKEQKKDEMDSMEFDYNDDDYFR